MMNHTTRRRSVFAHLVAFAAVFAVACGPRASKEECERMVDRMIDVELQGQSAAVASMTKSMMQGQRGDLVGQCAGKASKAEVTCVINAKSKADIDKCK
jgi:small lipoprotein (TIGR04454 family)